MIYTSQQMRDFADEFEMGSVGCPRTHQVRKWASKVTEAAAIIRHASDVHDLSVSAAAETAQWMARTNTAEMLLRTWLAWLDEENIPTPKQETLDWLNAVRAPVG